MDNGGGGAIGQTNPQQNVSAQDNSTRPSRNPVSLVLNFLMKRPFLVIVPILVAVVAIGGIYAYNNIYFSPDKVLERTLTKMKDVNSFAVDGKIALSLNSKDTGVDLMTLLKSNQITANLTGSVDYKDKSKVKSDLKLDVKTGANTIVNGEVKVLDQSSYLYLNNIDGLESALLGANSQGYFSFLTGSWIKLDQEDLRPYGYDKSSNSNFDVNSGMELLGENNPLMIAAQLPSEQIDGQDMFHYGFTLSKDNLKAFLLELQKMLYNEELGPAAEMNLESTLNKISLTDGQMWIGKDDYYLHKVLLGTSISGENGDSTGLDITLQFSDHNKEVNVEAPEGAKTIKDMLDALQSTYSSSQSTPTF